MKYLNSKPAIIFLFLMAAFLICKNALATITYTPNEYEFWAVETAYESAIDKRRALLNEQLKAFSESSAALDVKLEALGRIEEVADVVTKLIDDRSKINDKIRANPALKSMLKPSVDALTQKLEIAKTKEQVVSEREDKIIEAAHLRRAKAQAEIKRLEELLIETQKELDRLGDWFFTKARLEDVDHIEYVSQLYDMRKRIKPELSDHLEQEAERWRMRIIKRENEEAKILPAEPVP